MTSGGIRLRELAAELGREVEGDGEVSIAGVAELAHAGPADLAFARSARHAAALAATRAGAVIVPPGLDAGGRPAIRSPHPGLDFARAARRVVTPQSPAAGVHASAQVSPGAGVDPSASVGPLCAVGARTRIGPGSVLHARVVLYDDVEVGAHCVIHAGCVLREGTRLGDRVVLQPGVVLGGDGFGFALDESGRLEKSAQLGRVRVEDDVEIGANSTVDRATLGETRIARGAKIDNLVQIGHNCDIGPDAVIVAQAGLAGSTRVGAGAMVMAQAGVAGHLAVGERAFVGPQSGVHRDVPPGARVLGSPQREEHGYHRAMAALSRLPELIKRVRALERKAGLRDA